MTKSFEELKEWVTKDLFGGPTIPKEYAGEIALVLSHVQIPRDVADAWYMLEDTILFWHCAYPHGEETKEGLLRETLKGYEEKGMKITENLSWYQYFILYMLKLRESTIYEYVDESKKHFSDFEGQKGTYFDCEDVFEPLHNYEGLFKDYYKTKEILKYLLRYPI